MKHFSVNSDKLSVQSFIIVKHFVRLGIEVVRKTLSLPVLPSKNFVKPWSLSASNLKFIRSKIWICQLKEIRRRAWLKQSLFLGKMYSACLLKINIAPEIFAESKRKNLKRSLRTQREVLRKEQSQIYTKWIKKFIMQKFSVHNYCCRYMVLHKIKNGI
jgi:hypothetical protein